MNSTGEEQTATKDAAPKKETPQTKSKMEKVFGFRKEDLTSWHSLVTLLNRPTDPASLGIFRCLFGKLTCHLLTLDCLLLGLSGSATELRLFLEATKTLVPFQHHLVSFMQVC